MIHMPRRSVTRFFIPLIDVLLLLFCIFLLMPFVAEENSGVRERLESVEELQNRIKSLERQREEDRKKLLALERLNESLAELEQLRARVKELSELKYKDLHKNSRFIDIDADNGTISYYHPKDRKVLPIANPKSASELIQRLQNEAAGEELNFVFLMPRKPTVKLTEDQVKDYNTWFSKTKYYWTR